MNEENKEWEMWLQRSTKKGVNFNKFTTVTKIDSSIEQIISKLISQLK